MTKFELEIHKNAVALFIGGKTYSRYAKVKALAERPVKEVLKRKFKIDDKC